MFPGQLKCIINAQKVMVLGTVRCPTNVHNGTLTITVFCLGTVVCLKSCTSNLRLQLHISGSGDATNRANGYDQFVQPDLTYFPSINGNMVVHMRKMGISIMFYNDSESVLMDWNGSLINVHSCPLSHYSPPFNQADQKFYSWVSSTKTFSNDIPAH